MEGLHFGTEIDRTPWEHSLRKPQSKLGMVCLLLFLVTAGIVWLMAVSVDLVLWGHGTISAVDELSSDGVLSGQLTCSEPGTLTKLMCKEGEVAEAGDVVAWIINDEINELVDDQELRLIALEKELLALKLGKSALIEESDAIKELLVAKERAAKEQVKLNEAHRNAAIRRANIQNQNAKSNVTVLTKLELQNAVAKVECSEANLQFQLTETQVFRSTPNK